MMGDERKRGRDCTAQRGNEGEKEEGDLKRSRASSKRMRSIVHIYV